jgi:Lon protease-like protein
MPTGTCRLTVASDREAGHKLVCMPAQLSRDFPLFPLGLVALPGEMIPLHIFEERYKTMMNECLVAEREFGIVWLSDDGLRDIGCACEIDRVLEQMDDGRMNLLARGTRPFRVLERQGHLPYPAGVIEFVEDRLDPLDPQLASEARSAYADLVKRATDREPDGQELEQMGAYEMAATVDFGLDAKQGLLDLRSENARLRLVMRLFRAAIKRLDFVDRAQTRARSNGKVRFG